MMRLLLFTLLMVPALHALECGDFSALKTVMLSRYDSLTRYEREGKENRRRDSVVKTFWQKYRFEALADSLSRFAAADTDANFRWIRLDVMLLLGRYSAADSAISSLASDSFSWNRLLDFRFLNGVARERMEDADERLQTDSTSALTLFQRERLLAFYDCALGRHNRGVRRLISAYRLNASNPGAAAFETFHRSWQRRQNARLSLLFSLSDLTGWHPDYAWYRGGAVGFDFGSGPVSWLFRFDFEKCRLRNPLVFRRSPTILSEPVSSFWSVGFDVGVTAGLYRTETVYAGLLAFAGPHVSTYVSADRERHLPEISDVNAAYTAGLFLGRNGNSGGHQGIEIVFRHTPSGFAYEHPVLERTRLLFNLVLGFGNR